MASDDFETDSGYEIGIVYKQSQRWARQQLKDLHNFDNVKIYPFIEEELLLGEIDTPFSKAIYLHALLNSQILYGKKLSEIIHLQPIIKDDKLLLIHRFKNGDEYWVIPGGGVEDEENLNEALIREVKEETSLDLVSSTLIGNFNESDHEHYFYKCNLSEGEPSLGGPEKENATVDNVYILEWIPVATVKILSNLFPDPIKKFKTEEKFYNFLRFQYIPPQERVGSDELKRFALKKQTIAS